ncbi:amidohydrolase family protein [Novosphingobium bradum]|uniref:Amidohydrolase family protein n=1 Tax=Novosphingobium bradum TaxID=1737444 RepID=A0ABV7IM34_9SPHN
MDIVDTQVHLNHWMDEATTIAAMNALGISAMLVDEAWDFGEGRPPHAALPYYVTKHGANRPISPGGSAAALRHPDRFSFLLRVNPLDPELEAWVEQAAATPGFRAMRYLLADKDDAAALLAGARMGFFQAASDHDLVVFAGGHSHAPLFEPYAKAFPSLPIVIDHCGFPLGEGAFERTLDLARYPNVHLKWSHAPCVFGAKAFPYPEVRPFLNRALEAFGRERIMWASDFTAEPAVRTTCGGPDVRWADALYYMKCNPDLSEGDLEWVLGGTARKVLRWEQAA